MIRVTAILEFLAGSSVLDLVVVPTQEATASNEQGRYRVLVKCFKIVVFCFQ